MRLREAQVARGREICLLGCQLHSGIDFRVACAVATVVSRVFLKDFVCVLSFAASDPQIVYESLYVFCV